MARVAQFVAASTNAGDGGQVQRLTAPRQLDDGDASTVWTEGRPGPGQGEFVTARLIPGDYLVHSLAITLAPAQTEESQPAAIGRLRRFTVLLGSAQGLQRYEVTVPQDPARFPGEPVWLTLPEPTSVRCLSLVLGERWPQTAAEAPTGLAEIAVFTDLDQAGNRDRLSQLLRQTGGGNEALLRALGAAVIPVIEEAWPSLNTVTRRRAVRLLAATNTSRTAPLLAEAALSNDEATARTARQGLRPLGDAAVVALAAQADADNQERAVQIAQLVALMGTNRAASWLVEQVATLALTESRPWDLLVARGLSRADAEVRQDALRRAAEIEGVNQYLLLAGLVPLRDEEVEPFTELVGQAWEGNDSFESRYRLLALAGRMTDHQALSALVRQSLLENDDRYLRARAAEVLASGGPDGEARQWLAEAAHDEWPGVRHAAAQALARRGPGGQVQVMADLLARDPWPVVRAASATALGRPEVTQAESLLVPALLDPSPLVQITVARLLGQGQSETTLVPLTELADDEETSIKVRQAAVGAVGTLCREPAQDTLLRWVQRGLEEGQPVAMRQVAASAATALAPYGADEVLALLTRASNEGVPGMRLAAIEALGQQGRQEARPVLERLAQDSLPPIRAAAASALRMLDRPSENHACPVHSNR
jgi:HEAT repeat protein